MATTKYFQLGGLAAQLRGLIMTNLIVILDAHAECIDKDCCQYSLLVTFVVNHFSYRQTKI